MNLARLNILLLLLLGITSTLSANVLIQGTLPQYPGKFITVYAYSDMLSLSRKQIVLEDGIYTIFEGKSNLSVEDKKGFPINKVLSDIDNDLLHNWCPLFIDTTNGEFKRSAHEASVLQKLSAIEKKYSPGDGNYPDQLLRFKAAFFKLWFLSSTSDIRSHLDQFRDEYFSSSTYPSQNPFYAEALGSYMNSRINNIQNIQAGSSSDIVTRVLNEAAMFKSRLLQQLAIVAGLKQIYRYPLEQGEKAKITDRIKNEPFVKTFEEGPAKILEDVIIKFNSLKVGDKFPVLPIKNRNGQAASIKDINTDLILIDFWATWCFPCREAMTKFEDWINQCNGNLTIVSISVDDDLSIMNKFLDKRKPPLPTIDLYNGKRGNYFTRMSINRFPSYYILNSNKEIIAMPASTDSVLPRLKGFL